MALVWVKAKEAQDVIRWMRGQPSEAEIEAGNYRKATIDWHGLKLKIENPSGSVREHGAGETRMLCPYGYIAGTEGADGDEIDVYIGSQLYEAPLVYVVQQRQVDNWLSYDEDKVMIGFMSKDEARRAYQLHYDDERFLGPVVPLTVDEFVRRAKASITDNQGSIA